MTSRGPARVLPAPARRVDLRVGAPRWWAPLCLVALLSAGAGCRGAYEGEVAVDADVRIVGVLDEAGAGSSLVPWPPGAPLPVVTRGPGPHLVLGFTEAQLAPFEGAWSQGNLRAAAPCEAALPAPRWAGRMVDGALAAADPAALPALTVDGLSELCPAEADAPLALDVRGPGERCPYRITRSGCRVEVATECGLGSLQGYLHPDGDVCLLRQGGAWRCRDEALGLERNLTCLEPTVEVGIVSTAPGPAPFEAELVQVVARPVVLPQLWASVNQLYYWNLNSGLAFGMAVLSDRVVVAHTRDGPGGDCAAEENRAQAFTFVGLDAAPLGTVEAPRCARGLEEEAGGASFLGLYLDARERFRLARFDAQGALQSDGVVPGSSRWRPGPRGMIVRPEVDQVLLFMPRPLGEGDVLVLEHRRSTLAHVRTATLSGVLDLLGAGLLDGGRVFAAADEDHFFSLDADSLAVLERGVHPAQNIYPSRFVGQATMPPGTAAIFINGPPAASLLRVDRGAALGRIRLALDPTFAPSAAAVWPGGRWLVGGPLGASAGDPAALVLYDAEADRFLPGTHVLGQGAVSRMAWDDAGHLWVLYPWAGQVARLTPR
jgi:hypothetical protein